MKHDIMTSQTCVTRREGDLNNKMVRITKPLYKSMWAGVFQGHQQKYVHILASLLLHPGRLTWNLRTHPWKMKIIFQTIIWVFPKILVPQNGWFIMENPIKIDDLGIYLFLETPIFRFELLIFGGDPSKIILPAPDISHQKSSPVPMVTS